MLMYRYTYMKMISLSLSLSLAHTHVQCNRSPTLQKGLSLSQPTRNHAKLVFTRKSFWSIVPTYIYLSHTHTYTICLSFARALLIYLACHSLFEYVSLFHKYMYLSLSCSFCISPFNISLSLMLFLSSYLACHSLSASQ